MKSMIVTTPLRPIPTGYPPMGSLSVIKYLRKNGIDDVEFYNIDSNRPSYTEALAHIVTAKPDVLGISAVVSTAYAFTKQLSLDIKKALPDTLVVVGGNLAASAEILLRKTGTDLCVLGEGEKSFLNIVRRAAETRIPARFADIPGLALIDETGTMVNTGYEAPLSKNELYDFDWEDLAASSDISRFIFDPFQGDKSPEWLAHDRRVAEPHRQGKKVVELHAAKGCVARCTFCHRFEKGIRYIPVDILRERIRVLVDDFDVGFLVVADENFGTDRRWLVEFCAMIRPFDILWRVAGMRVNCISPAQIEMMKDAGCVSIIYGMETGSERMLEVMEKKTKIQQNRDAMSWTIEAGLYSIIQLVIGMPGESPETIAETIEFCKFGLTLDPGQNPNNLSINYAQALPGTPLYEYGRRVGLIACNLTGEEEYLLRISDRNAHDEQNTLNFTGYPMLEIQTWRPLITIETNYAYVKKFGLAHYRKVLLNDTNYFRQKRADDGRFANPRRLIDTSIATDSVHGTKTAFELSGGPPQLPSLFELIRRRQFGMALICYPIQAYRIRHFLPWITFLKNAFDLPFGTNARLLGEYLAFKVGLGHRPRKSGVEGTSLRKTLAEQFDTVTEDTPAMTPLRKGR